MAAPPLDRLLDLLAHPGHRSQGIELLRAFDPATRRETLERAVHARRWSEAVWLLADGSPSEHSRLSFVLYADLMLRLVALRAALGSPLPDNLPALLQQLRAAPGEAQPALWRYTCDEVARQQPLPPQPPAGLYQLLARGLRKNMDAEAMLAQLRAQYHDHLQQQSLYRWFVRQPMALGRAPRLLATTRASQPDGTDWPQRWAALCTVPVPEQIARVERELDHAAWLRLQQLLVEEEQALADLVLTEGAACPHLFGTP